MHSDPENHSLWDHLSDHPKVAAVLAFIAFAATFSPKASTVATWVCIGLAWAFAVMVVAGIPWVTIHSRRIQMLLSASVIIGLAGVAYGRWLTDQNTGVRGPTKEEIASEVLKRLPMPSPGPPPFSGKPSPKPEQPLPQEQPTTKAPRTHGTPSPCFKLVPFSDRTIQANAGPNPYMHLVTINRGKAEYLRMFSSQATVVEFAVWPNMLTDISEPTGKSHTFGGFNINAPTTLVMRVGAVVPFTILCVDQVNGP